MLLQHHIANLLYQILSLTNNFCCVVSLNVLACQSCVCVCVSHSGVMYCMCGVLCRLCVHNPVEVPTCHGAFVRINIYLSCALSHCHVVC